MYLIEELSTRHHLWWKTLAFKLKMRSQEFEIFREQYALNQSIKAQLDTPEVTTTTTSANGHVS